MIGLKESCDWEHPIRVLYFSLAQLSYTKISLQHCNLHQNQPLGTFRHGWPHQKSFVILVPG